MLAALWFAVAFFFYSLFAFAASRLFNHFDPSSAYSDESPGTFLGTDGKLYQKWSPRALHGLYIFFGSVLWPAVLILCVLFYIPYRIVLRVERGVDQPKPYERSESDGPYRGWPRP